MREALDRKYIFQYQNKYDHDGQNMKGGGHRGSGHARGSGHEGGRHGGGQNGGEQAPVVTVIQGISTSDPFSGFLIPPDNGTAVDSGYIVQNVNSVIRWTDLSGGNAVEQNLSSFFASLPNYGFFIDSRAIYDATSGRFIVSAGTESTDSPPAGNAAVLVGVSNDGNPNDGWSYYRYQFDPGANLVDTHGVDQPVIAADGSSLYVAATVSDAQNSEQLALVVPNEGAGTPIQLDLGNNNIAGIYKQVASQGIGDYALAQNNGTLTLQHITAAGMVDGTSSVVLGSIGASGNLSSTNGEQYLPTAGESIPLDAGDTRIYGLSQVQNGTVWATFEVTPTSGRNAGVANVHWAELNVSDPSHIAVLDQGTVSGAVIGAGVGTETGSVAVDRAGDVILNFVASGPDLTPTDYFMIKRANEATFSAPVQWDGSAGPYVEPGAGMFGPEVASRWGDYSSAVADPNNPHGFYISNEIGNTPNDFGWSTPIAHVTIPSVTV